VRRPSPALVIACLALLVALTGTSYATVLNVPKNSVGTSALKRNAVKPAKLAPNAVRTAHVLNGSLLAADFKAGQIPQGAKGDKGDKGDRGDKGDTGSPGVAAVELVSAASAFDSSSTHFVDVTCPSGKKLLGGGGTVDNAAGFVDLYASRPLDADTWHARAWEVNATTLSWRVIAYAVCANVAS
jgi:hypothetical protein